MRNDIISQEIETKQGFNQLTDNIDNIKKELNNQKSHILGQERISTLLNEEMKKWFAQPMSVEQMENISHIEDHLLDAMYLNFENQFRGTRQQIREMQRVYLPYLESTKTVTKDTMILDLGCGRGEWLELLKENGYIAKGIDTNKVMVRQCMDLSLEVVEADVIEYLRSQEDNSFGAITGFHIVEHLPFKTLVALFDESFRILKPGGIIIFETPNPENIIVGACNFYFDPTHRNPIPPITLKYLIEARGFENTEILRLHPYNYFDDKIDNVNIDKQLRLLFDAEQDYSVIGHKT